MVTANGLDRMSMKSIIEQYPFAQDWLEGYGFTYLPQDTYEKSAKAQVDGFYENNATTTESFLCAFAQYLNDMVDFLSVESEDIKFITILPGTDKDGNAEAFDKLELKPGLVTAVVGNTGSGKSRLLADIEWGAEKDTPTKRTVLFNGRPRTEHSFSHGKKMVAQLSQNMNFVLDMDVASFIKMHEECFTGKSDMQQRVFETARDLCGEKFSLDTHITNLSGGQSRALMIADCALLSDSPIVLIDEIENAGIDRKKALKLLTGEDKIVLIATHDPVLALLAHTRIIIENGGISGVMERNSAEHAVLAEVEKIDARMMELRGKLRSGQRLL